MATWKVSLIFGLGVGAGSASTYLTANIWLPYFSTHFFHVLLLTATVGAELLVALVIYYEVEEHRASTFMGEIQGDLAYTQRANVYDKYSGLSGTTLTEKAEEFRKIIWQDPYLREICDSQWTYFNRLRYSVRQSLFHRRIASTWFPQVSVSFWCMTAPYLRERQTLRPTPITNFGLLAVKESLLELKKQGLKPLTIYSKDGNIRSVISVSDLESMIRDLDSPFK